jgi:hypothetical protein
MIKQIVLSTLLILSLLQFSSCSHYKSIENAERMVDLARNPFMKRLTKSIYQDIRLVSNASMLGEVKIFKPTTPIYRVLSSDMAGDFTSLLSKKYHIPLNKMEGRFQEWKTIRDVVAFVAKHGSGFQLYIE